MYLTGMCRSWCNVHIVTFAGIVGGMFDMCCFWFNVHLVMYVGIVGVGLLCVVLVECTSCYICRYSWRCLYWTGMCLILVECSSCYDCKYSF